jgi:hypothetical protein
LEISVRVTTPKRVITALGEAMARKLSELTLYSTHVYLAHLGDIFCATALLKIEQPIYEPLRLPQRSPPECVVGRRRDIIVTFQTHAPLSPECNRGVAGALNDGPLLRDTERGIGH